jgi:hypothetical protein
MKSEMSQQIRTLVSCLTMIAMAALLATTVAEPFKVLAA